MRHAPVDTAAKTMCSRCGNEVLRIDEECPAISDGEMYKRANPEPGEKGERIPSGERDAVLRALATKRDQLTVYRDKIDGSTEVGVHARTIADGRIQQLVQDMDIVRSTPPAKAEDGMREVDDAMVERANAAYETSVQALYAQAVHISVDLAEVRTKSMRAALRAALAKEGTP